MSAYGGTAVLLDPDNDVKDSVYLESDASRLLYGSGVGSTWADNGFNTAVIDGFNPTGDSIGLFEANSDNPVFYGLNTGGVPSVLSSSGDMFLDFRDLSVDFTSVDKVRGKIADALAEVKSDTTFGTGFFSYDEEADAFSIGIFQVNWSGENGADPTSTSESLGVMPVAILTGLDPSALETLETSSIAARRFISSSAPTGLDSISNT